MLHDDQASTDTNRLGAFEVQLGYRISHRSGSALLSDMKDNMQTHTHAPLHTGMGMASDMGMISTVPVPQPVVVRTLHSKLVTKRWPNVDRIVQTLMVGSTHVVLC